MRKGAMKRVNGSLNSGASASLHSVKWESCWLAGLRAEINAVRRVNWKGLDERKTGNMSGFDQNKSTDAGWRGWKTLLRKAKAVVLGSNPVAARREPASETWMVRRRKASHFTREVFGALSSPEPRAQCCHLPVTANVFKCVSILK